MEMRISTLLVITLLGSSRLALAQDPAPAAPAAAPADGAETAPTAAAPAAPPGAAPPPGVAPWEQVVDRERRPPRPRRRFGLLIAGLCTFAAAYAGSVSSFVFSEDLYGRSIGPELLVPVAGPWLALSSTRWEVFPVGQRELGQATMIIYGGAQAAGVVLSIVGISLYVASGTPESPRARTISFQFAPTIGGGLGIASGRF